MTPSEISSLIDKHLTGWLGSDAPEPTLRDRIAAMIAEAESARDKLWADGNATLKHELNSARYVARHARQTLDDLHILIDDYGVTGQSDGSIQSKINAVCQERERLKLAVDAVRVARDDAVQAAHLIAEQLAECKRRGAQ